MTRPFLPAYWPMYQLASAYGSTLSKTSALYLIFETLPDNPAPHFLTCQVSPTQTAIISVIDSDAVHVGALHKAAKHLFDAKVRVNDYKKLAKDDYLARLEKTPYGRYMASQGA